MWQRISIYSLMACVLDGKTDVVLACKCYASLHVTGTSHVDRKSGIITECTGLRPRGKRFARLVLEVGIYNLSWDVDAVLKIMVR